ncbi:MAG TPA: hypothetical protein VN973_00765 [Candidatus Dormibacteraeota bacterium]|nr:hypothetical protein [Candidatus Dormibacteraeota bacterium]
MAVARRAARQASEPTPLPHGGVWWRRIPLALGVALTTIAPIGLAMQRTPAGHAFTGYVVIARDAFVYQSLWRAGGHGAWLFHPIYSNEPQPGILIYAWYLWTGHLVGVFAGPWLYHAARLGAALALLAAVWALVSTLYRPRSVRRWAMILATLGGGVGVLLGTGLHLGPVGLRPTEALVAGTSVADVIAMAPHLAWAGALLCWTFTACLRWTRIPRPSLYAGGLGAALGLELIYPQLCILALSTIVAWAILRRQRRGLFFAGGAAIVTAPYLVYLAWAQASIPTAFVGVGATAQVPFHFDVGDPIGFVVLSHLVASALIVGALAFRRIRGDLLLPAAWIVIMTAFMFIPVMRSVVGRSYLISSVPFGIVAAAGLVPLLRRIRRGRRRRRVLALVLASSSLFGLISVVQPFGIALARLDPNAEYERSGEAGLLRWLAAHSSSKDLVLTTYLDGVFVPAQTDARAYVGHPDQTVDVAAKAASALAYFRQWDAAQRDAFLRANRIDYVLAGDPSSVERLLSDPLLRVAHKDGGEALFRVVSP